ncbi:MAG: hypothetical protein OXQ92_05940 [Boseongicola sp.]|nr:hypothetical protein [Boseongicola sp.]MDD9977343.1 hypothetical protein [Boseongicola sp.]
MHDRIGQKVGGLPFGIVTVLMVVMLCLMMLRPLEAAESPLAEALGPDVQTTELTL